MKKIIWLVFVAFLTTASFSPSFGMSSPISSIHPPVDTALVKESIIYLKSLSKQERKSKFKEAKKLIKDFKSAKKAGEDPDTNIILLAILALFLPPLAVYLHQGETNKKFWITTLLFALGIFGLFIFGWYLVLASIIYALIVILGNK